MNTHKKNIFDDKVAYNNAILNLQECKSRKKVINSYPLKIYIEPTTDCNLDCAYCIPKNIREKQEMDMNIFYALRDQLFNYCCEVNLFLEGEPTLYKNFAEMLDICSKYPFITKFFSNLSYRNNEILKKMVESGSWLNVSFDGIEVSEKARKGTNIKLVEHNIRYLIEYQKKIKNDKFHIRLAVVVSKINVEKLTNIIEWADELGFKEIMFGCIDTTKYNKKIALTKKDVRYFNEAVNKCDKIDMRVSTPTHIGGKLVEKSSNWKDFELPIDKYFPHFIEDCNPDVRDHFCPYPWIQAVFRTDGEVVSCCQRKINLGKFNPNVNFIEEVWNNSAYQKIRSNRDFRKCSKSKKYDCNMMRYSIWGGDCRLNDIPAFLN